MYWIAINESYSAMCAVPCKRVPIVTPTPNVILGFPTLTEAQSALNLFLKASIRKVAAAITQWRSANSVQIIQCSNPATPRGEMVWSFPPLTIFPDLKESMFFQGNVDCIIGNPPYMSDE